MSRRSFTFRLLAVLLFLLSGLTHALASDTHARVDERSEAQTARLPFEPSEELIYEADFSRSLLRGIKIAEFRFTFERAAASADKAASPAGANGQAEAASTSGQTPRPFLFTGDVVSRGWFRKLFGINFRYRVESVVEPRTFSVLRTTKLDEQGKRVRTSEAVFDPEQRRVTWTERDPNDPRRDPRVVNSSFEGAPQTHDIITAIYFLRTQALAPGQQLELVVSDSGRVFTVPVQVFAEKKPLKTAVGRVPVVRVEVGVFGAGRLIDDEGQMTIWMTSDARRLPVRAKLQSSQGQIDITIKRIAAPARY